MNKTENIVADYFTLSYLMDLAAASGAPTNEVIIRYAQCGSHQVEAVYPLQPAPEDRQPGEPF